MSENVNEFMEKPYKAYACGKGNGRIIKTLSNAFKGTSKEAQESEKQAFAGLMHLAMQVPEGRETVVALAEMGYSFAFEATAGCDGFCSPNRKKIVLNPNSSVESLLPVFVHEGRHAIQDNLKSTNEPPLEKMCISSMYQDGRATEADAYAHEMAFIYQMKDVYPSVYETMEAKKSPIFEAFVGEMNRSGDEKKAMQQTFESFYDFERIRDFYDGWHKDWVKEGVRVAVANRDTRAFSDQKYAAADVLKKCVYQGEPYMDEAFLNSPKAFSLSAEDKKEVTGLMDGYVSAVKGAKADKSVMTMYTRGKSGNAFSNVVAAKVSKKKGR